MSSRRAQRHSAHQLFTQHQDCLQAEFAAAKVKQVLKGGGRGGRAPADCSRPPRRTIGCLLFPLHRQHTRLSRAFPFTPPSSRTTDRERPRRATICRKANGDSLPPRRILQTLASSSSCGCLVSRTPAVTHPKVDCLNLAGSLAQSHQKVVHADVPI